MPNVGLFLLLAFIGPGIVIFSCLLLLWPELRPIVFGQQTEIYIFLTVSIAFLNGHIPFLLERSIFDHVWNTFHPQLKLLEKRDVVLRKSTILISPPQNT